MHPTWYLLQTKPNAHHIAQRNLERQGFGVFLPMIEQTRRSGIRFLTDLRPLFPGYLFLGLSDASPSWGTINATYGVSRAVSLDGQYRPVPIALIQGLRERCDAENVFCAKESLSEGDLVQIKTGPFSDFVAEIVSLAPDQRVWVLIELLGQKSRIALDRNQVRQA